MQCFQCGSEQPGGNAFCTKCGAQLAGATVPERQPDEVNDNMAVSTSAKEEEEKILRELKEALKGVDSGKANGELRTDRPASNASKKFVWASVVAVLVLVVVIGFELVRRKEGTPAPPPAPIETILPPPSRHPPTTTQPEQLSGRSLPFSRRLSNTRKPKMDCPLR